MRFASVAEVKNGLSEYLAQARRKEEQLASSCSSGHSATWPEPR